MAFTKYTVSESFEVLKGDAREVVKDHAQKVGKASLTEFSKTELDALESDLIKAKKTDGK